MSEAKFTPSPWVSYWRTSESDEADCGVFHEARPGHAHAIARCPKYVKEETWKANGALIAAAPDLYAALVGVMELGCCSDEGICGIEQSNTWNNARAALAKARGES